MSAGPHGADPEAADPGGSVASVRPALSWAPVLLVAVGAGVGSVARFAVESWLGGEWSALWVVNLAGSFVLGLLAGGVAHRGHGWTSPALGTGLLGGFTTFSTAAVAAWSSVWGIGQLIALTASCVALAAVGHWLGRQLS